MQILLCILQTSSLGEKDWKRLLEGSTGHVWQNSVAPPVLLIKYEWL